MSGIKGVHPHAEFYPLLGDDELAALAEDIRENGLRDAVTVTPDGLLIDGRNRARACERLGIEPETVTYEGDDIGAFVRSRNMRRHQSMGSLAMSTALSLQADRLREGGRWQRGSVPTSESGNRLWAQRIAECGVVLDHAPDLAEQVVAGDLALDAAFRQAEQNRDAERRRLEEEERLAAEEADAKTFVTEQAPDLAARVDGADLLTYVEARDLWNRRNREEAERIRREKAAREAEARAEREQAEQEVQTSARALLALAGARHPEWRQRVRAAHAKHPEAVEPTARAMWSVENIRLLTTWLSALADEMEQASE